MHEQTRRMSIAWQKIAAGGELAIAVFLTTEGRHMQEKLRFAHFAREILSRRYAHLGALVTMSGNDLDDALSGLSLPNEAVQILVISPYAAERPRLIAEARARWPFAMAAHDAGAIEDNAYIVVDLRPCLDENPSHVHSPVCLASRRSRPFAAGA